MSAHMPRFLRPTRPRRTYLYQAVFIAIAIAVAIACVVYGSRSDWALWVWIAAELALLIGCGPIMMNLATFVSGSLAFVDSPLGLLLAICLIVLFLLALPVLAGIVLVACLIQAWRAGSAGDQPSNPL